MQRHGLDKSKVSRAREHDAVIGVLDKWRV